MSKLTYNLIPAARRGDVAGLKSVISKLENHLKSTNDKLGEFRQRIRTESNIKTRNVYLKKVCNKVKEQHTIKSILENYKKKLKELESRKQLKLEIKPTPQQTKNSKLFELFQNYDSTESKATNNSNVSQTSIGKKRKLKDDEEKTEGSSSHSETDEVQAWQNENTDFSMIEDSKHSTDDSQLQTQTEQNVGEELTTGENDNIEVKIEEEEYQISNADSTENPFTINNHGDAMQCLKALMEYALMNENFRAIGLLLQTENVFTNPPEVSDFEV